MSFIPEAIVLIQNTVLAFALVAMAAGAGEIAREYVSFLR